MLDGRDIGTVIFPEAPVKLFVTASPAARARAALAGTAGQGRRRATRAQVEAELRARDAQDAGRSAAPLKPAPDALQFDTTALDAEAAFETALALVHERLAAAG